MFMRFKYVEKQNGNSTDKEVEVRIPSTNKSGNSFTFSIPNVNIFSLLRAEIGVAPAGVERFVDSPDIFIYGAGAAYSEYLNSLQLQTGITGDQAQPLYTNFAGQDFYGVYSTRAYTFKLNVPVDSTLVDSLNKNSITAPLNFKGYSDH